MNRFFSFILLFFLLGCSPENEPPKVDSIDVDATMSADWDTSMEYSSTNTDSALFYMRKVRSLAEANGRRKWEASAYGAIADIQKDRGDLGEAVYHYLYAAKIFQEIGELSRMANAYNSLGYVYMKARNYETAISYFQKAKDVYFYEGSSDDKAMVAHNLGICYREIGKEEEAKAILTTGLKEVQSKKIASNIYNTLGVLYFKKGLQEKAREQFQLSMQYAGQGADSIKVVAGAYNNIGETYLVERDFERAEKWLNRGLVFKKEINDPILVQSILNTLGKLKIEQGYYEEAVLLVEEGLQEIDPAVVDDAVGESLSLINEALVKSSRTENIDHMARLNRQLSTYSQRLVRHNQQLVKLQDKLEIAGRQQGLALSEDKFTLAEKLGQSEEENEQIKLAAFLLPAFILLLAAAIIFWFIRRQRRSKAIFGAIEDVLNKSAMRHMDKR